MSDETTKHIRVPLEHAPEYEEGRQKLLEWVHENVGPGWALGEGDARRDGDGWIYEGDLVREDG